MSWIESIVYFSGLGEGGSVNDLKDRVMHDKKFFKAKSDYVRSPITYVDLYGAFEVLAEQSKAYLILDPYGGLMSRIESDAIPFPHRDGNIYAVQYLIEWRREDDWRSDEYMKWLRLFYEYMRPFVSAGPRAAYVNYLDLDLGTTGSMVRMMGPVIRWLRRGGSGRDIMTNRKLDVAYVLTIFVVHRNLVRYK
ncbi:hypothetical protein QJS10_CPA03g02088 [Acorus calamus]|uniref:Uncharacterized protein n=1 Tax=Acorus calamus TaxID=4465 RepID=A0AAV9FA03_ACOCL|nr:hypothetical protein QJS10_CPA03g02088 [Acorus calamus]